MILAAWLGALHTLWVAAAPPESVCRIEREGHSSAVLTLQSEWDGWPNLCEALGDYLALPPAPLGTKHSIASVEALKGLGYFGGVQCGVEDAGNLLACTLTPGLIVHSFDLVGDVPFALLRSDVRRRVFLRPGTLLGNSEAQAKRQSQRLTAFLDDEGYFGTEVNITYEPQPGVEPNEGVHVTIHVKPGKAAVLRDLRIKGSPRVPQDDVARTFRHWWFLYTPARFRPAQFLDDLRAATELLQEKGWPAAHVTGKYEHDAEHDAVDVSLEITPGPKVVLNFTGSDAISKSSLEDLAGFRSAGAVDTVAIEEMRAAVVTAFQRKGYHLAKVGSDVKQDADEVWNVTYAIDPGPKTRVQHVVFSGNASYSAADITRVTDLLIQESGFFNHPWVDTWATHDEAAIQAFYRARGFPDVRVSASPKAVSEDRIDAVFAIEEGRHLLVKSTHITGMPHDLPDDTWPTLSLQEGGPLVDTSLEKDEQALQTTLSSKGYIQGVAKPDIKDGDVTYNVTPGTQMRAGGLFLRGNFATRSSVLRNEMSVKPGDVLNLPALGAARRNLRGLNVFNTVDLKPLNVYPDVPVTWMLLAMEEREVRSLDAVLAFSSDDFFSIGADYSDRNLWGRANALDVQVRFADASDWIPKVRIGNEDRAEVKLRIARPFGFPFDSEATLLYDYQDLTLYRTRRAGGSAAVSKALLAAARCPACPTIVAKLGYELIETYFVYKDLTSDDPTADAAAIAALSAISIPNQTIARFIPSLSIDKRDSPIDPRSGYRWDGRIDIAHPTLAGPFSSDASAFWRVITGVQGYLNLGVPLTRRIDENRRVGGPVIAALSLQYSAAGPWTSHGYVPLSEAYAYGGDFSVRGLVADASTVAVPDAHYMLISTFELRWYAIPDLGFGSVQLAGFADLGSVSNGLRDLLVTNTVSAGPIIRYVTPVGPLSLAYGWAVVRPLAIAGPRPDVIPRNGRLHFTFGYSF